MNKAYQKDILRSIQKGWKRFLSILFITALGVAMLTGLYAACLDMYYSADKFYDEQKLFDIRILSTLGLTEEDIGVLAQVDGVETAEGGYSETGHIEVDGIRKTADVTMMSPQGLNAPYLLEGHLPGNAGEIAVTRKYLDESGKAIGDTLTLEEDQEPEEDATATDSGQDETDTETELELQEDISLEETDPLERTSFTITGVVMDPMDIQGSGADNIFRATASSDYTFFITPADVNAEVYTVAHLVLAGTRNMDSYSDQYDEVVELAISHIENKIKAQREQARYEDVVVEGRKKLEDAEATVDEKLVDADKKLSDARKELREAKQELTEGEATLNAEEKDAAEKLAQARAELNRNKVKLADAQKQLDAGEAQLKQGEAELAANAEKLTAGRQQLAKERQQAEEQFAAAGRQLDEAQTQLDQARARLEPQIASLKSDLGPLWPEQEWNALVHAAATLAAAGADDQAIAQGTGSESAALAAALPEGSGATVEAALGSGKITGGQQALDRQKQAYAEQKQAGLQQLADAAAELSAGEAQAQAKIADARKDIAEGKKELADGEAKLTEQEQEFAGKKEEAKQKLTDAYAKLDDIDTTRWYVQDRSSIDSYASLTSDLSSIEAVGKVFPIIFLIVAILMSLTSMTRMVEEERGLIGTYKALGFGNGTVYRKYLLFALLACLLGGVLGDLFGFVFMPKFVAIILEELYSLPHIYLRFDMLYGVGGVLLFILGIVGATFIACRSELVKMPAALMRPKAPRAGSRVFLERLPFIWNRLKFLNKVTVRNLFRYKKRLFMTVGGIMGCTALILCGFAIKDSIVDLAPKQYESIYQYDLMSVFEDKSNSELVQEISQDSRIADYLNLRIENAKAINHAEKGEGVQLMVIPDGASLKDYIRIKNLDGQEITPSDEGILLTRNAATILGLEAGSKVSLQDMELVQRETVVTDVVQNYLGNNVYMTQSLYEQLFGGQVALNGVLAHLSVPGPEQPAYAEQLLLNDSVLSAVSTVALRADFGFDLINAVVLLITAMAGGLAFVVLFTLSNTNISERVRELATIKVLGFYDKEVHQYVNKESLILTLIGILVGLPVGRVLSGFLTSALNMPAMYFAVHVEPVSYVLSAGITFCFAILVNWMTNRTLNRINMVEALKSVE
ncbi:ABC transporter permease [Paenibacillus senegalimassiliensis]|uniref:ABC transporter permease n=1 Tax=Paenibacillus senegalimassiliensis TaxID=1737426 RepID=UPI00073FA326|nr:ABC transporter permease [Paenibacillus senegalimassiliensis]